MKELPTTWCFYAKQEHFLGEKLSLAYAQSRPAYYRWLSRASKKTSASLGRQKLQQYMPAILPTYDGLCHSLGGDEWTASFLSLYNPPTFRAGCSQAAKTEGQIELVRNYDFPAQLTDRLLLHTNWNGTRVMAMTDCLWGVIDGMNEHGLAVSLAYGGRSKHGDGFAITLVLRYLLEFCTNTDDAVEVLKSVPILMPYNVTIVDRFANNKTVVICPGEPIEVSNISFATNHQQGGIIEDINAIADSYIRSQYLTNCLSDPRSRQRPLTDIFLKPPLLRTASDWSGWGTLYTVRYLPLLGVVELHWPNGQILTQSFDHFVEGNIVVSSPAFI